ncbi:hypothetical protein [Streptomyces sp. 049-1]|uniref:hypothetical protein n=1 Tax=Streptomyces sp. 049-1 TaxID=2789264 RepID=UPI003981037E
MTPTQVFIVSALGGLTAFVGLALFVGLAIGLYLLVSRAMEAAEEYGERRRRRRDRDTCHAILALPTADHPTE